MTRRQSYLLIALFTVAVMARLASLPVKPFFCDVPANVAAVESGGLTIQFPGYVPFHLVVKFISLFTGSAFSAIVLFSICCGIGAMIYVILFAYDRAGFPAALLATTVMGFSPTTVYFSCVGTSYTTDLLAMSAMIYHGNRALMKGSDRDHRFAVLWFLFGCLMRSLSFPFTALAVLFLLWRRPTRSNVIFTLCACAIGALLCIGLTFFYYGSWAAIKSSMGAPSTIVLLKPSLYWFAGNETRNIAFTVWALNIFLLVIAARLWTARKEINLTLAAYFSLLIVPYFGLMLWYICHAGYICLLLPAFICLPWLAEKRDWLDARAVPLSALIGLVCVLQFFVARPVPITNRVSLVLDTYTLIYTRQGIELSMFGNLKDWAIANHISGFKSAAELQGH